MNSLNRVELLNQIRPYYIQTRVNNIDNDFLEYEEDMISLKDLSKIISLLNTKENPNPYNSILLYITGISNEFNFIKGRSELYGGSAPDIDIDFSNRDKAVEIIIEEYGVDNVAYISTVGTFGLKSTLRKYFSVYSPKPQYDIKRQLLNKTEYHQHDEEFAWLEDRIPDPKFGKAPDLNKALDTYPELATNTIAQPWLRFAKEAFDTVDSYGVHASGIVISHFPLTEEIPIKYETVTETKRNGETEIKQIPITQFPMGTVEALGLIKYDFLKIDNLLIVQKTIDSVNERHNLNIDMKTIPDHDELTYQLLNKGLLSGVFQFETSELPAEMIRLVQPKSVLELSDISALVRPGPMQAGLHLQYAQNKKESTPPANLPDSLRALLAPSAWVLTYQEQVMRIFMDIASFTEQESDDIRRAIGKKKIDVIKPYEETFINNAVANNKLTEKEAKNFWDIIVGFADYAFNKSHSLHYSYLSYVCAYLKAHYPLEFFTELLTIRSDQDFDGWSSSAKAYHQELELRGCKILPPSINKSKVEFSIYENKILFGLGAIKNLGVNTASKIIEARGDNRFTDIWDFLYRCKFINIKVFQTLALAGVFDYLGYIRQELFTEAETIFTYISKHTKWLEKIEALSTATVVEEQKKEKQAWIEDQIQKAKLHKKNKTISVEDTFWLERADRIKRYREIDRQCSLSKEPLSAYLSDIELIEYEEYLSLRAKPLPKPGDEPIKPELTRQKTISLTYQDIIEQEKYLGIWVSKHPLQILFPHATSFKDCEVGETELIPCIVTRVKEILTKKTNEQMAFLSLQDTNMIVEGTVFASVWRKGKVSEGDIVEVLAKCENTNPYKFIVRSITKYKDNNE